MSDFLPKLPDNLKFSDQALTDLKEIWFHIAADNEYYADKIIVGIFKTLEKIISFPKIGKMRNDLLINLRSFQSGRFIIFYQITDFGVEVVRVVHGSRDIDSVFDKMIPIENVN